MKKNTLTGLTPLLSALAIATLSACGGSSNNDTPDTVGNDIPADISPNIPDIISPDKTSQAGVEVTQSFTVSDINQPVAISIEGGEYTVDNGTFTRQPGTVTVGQTVTVRLDSSTTFGGTSSAIVTVGDKDVTVSVITEDQDLQPEPILFDPVTNLAKGEMATSNQAKIEGINTGAPIKIEGGLYSIDGSEFTHDDGIIENGQQLQIQAIASTMWEDETEVKLTIGTSEVSWLLRTMIETIPPEATILFPRTNSLAIYDTIIVRGLATDNTGIERVLVNGVEASLETPVNIENGVSVEWQAKIATTIENRSISVEVYDTKGNFTKSAATTSIQKGYSLPDHVAHIEEEKKIWGDRGWYIEVIDLTTDVKQNIRVNMIGDGCYSPSLDEYFYISTTDPDIKIHEEEGATEIRLNIKSYNFATELSIDWGQFEVAAPQGNSAILIDQLTLHCDEMNNQVLVVSNLGKRDTEGLGQIHKLTLTDTPEITTVLTTGDTNFEDWTTAMSSLHNGKLVTLNQDSWGELSVFNSSNFNRENTISNELLYVKGLAVDAEADLTHLALNKGIYTFSHSDGQLSELSVVEPDDPLYFGNTYNFSRGSKGNLFVQDSDKDILIKVDPNNGERSEYLAPETIGEGIRLDSAIEMVIRSEGDLLYVLNEDRSSEGSAKLIEVDPNQGNRRLIASVDIESKINSASLALNESAEVLYVALNDQLYEISIETGTSKLLTSSTVGDGYTHESIDSIYYNEHQNTGELYIADGDTGAAFAVELTNNYHRRLISHLSRGSGPSMEGANGIVMVDNTLYVSVAGRNAVYSIDPANGNREAIPIDHCISFYGGVFDFSESLYYRIRYNPVDHLLVLPGWITRGIDLETKQCLIVNNQDSSDIQPSRDPGLYFILRGSAIEYLDARTSEAVFISR